jgi:hypothetical protein
MDAAQPRATSVASSRATHVEDAMLPPRLRRPLLLSSIAALAAQLALTAVAAAVTGGGDFPIIR